MKPTLIFALLLAAFAGAILLHARNDHPAPVSASNGQRSDALVFAIERALAGDDPRQLETVLSYLLPQLIEKAPARVSDLVACRAPSPPRDALRREVARRWITRDRRATVYWLVMLHDEAERRDGANIAFHALALRDPAGAISLADEFSVGSDDGSIMRLVGRWAAEDMWSVSQWLASQPDNARSRQFEALVGGVYAREQARQAR